LEILYGMARILKFDLSNEFSLFLLGVTVEVFTEFLEFLFEAFQPLVLISPDESQVISYTDFCSCTRSFSSKLS
jgi:hypothetical protein